MGSQAGAWEPAQNAGIQAMPVLSEAEGDGKCRL